VITVETRVTGSRRAPVPAWQVPPPSAWGAGGGRLTLRELIALAVSEQVAEFAGRQSDSRLVPFLTQQEIDGAAARGRVAPAPRRPGGEVDEGVAVGTAVQAFEDGLFLVLVDGEEQRDLDGEIAVAPTSRVTFLRLVALAGG
jgi:hypothetical protein